MNDNEKTRDCDVRLYLEVCRVLNPAAMREPFSAVIADLKGHGYPSIETVTRLRRKLQAEYPELRATEQVEKWRSIKEEQARAGIFAF